MTTIEVTMATWEGIDAMLAELQKELGAGTLGGGTLGDVLRQIREDLAVLRAVERAQRGTPVAEPTAVDPAPASNLPPPTPLATGREEMIGSGFTGNFCPDCGSARMVRSGTCETCQECGANTGCS